MKNLVNLLFLTFGTLFILPSVYVNKQVYESLKGQMFLLQDFNSNNYNLPLNQVIILYQIFPISR